MNPKEVLLIIMLFLSVAFTQPTSDLVTDFPFPYNQKWYSGYLDFSMGNFHYVYFESQHDPSNDPLVLWLNGGPGCSSMLGMLYENGPFIFKSNTSVLYSNLYSWNKKANLLYIESPGGVGFSKGSREVYDDNNTAKDNLDALLAFFKKFPMLRKNSFYITGESYSGIYVPYLAYQILKYNKISKNININLKGIMVGNACTHPKECYDATAQGNSMYQYQFLYNHGYYTDSQYSQLLSACILNFHSQECLVMRDKFDQAFDETQSDILNIYGPCYRQSFGKKLKNRKIHKSIFQQPSNFKGDTDCADFIGILTLLNSPQIQNKLHVEKIQFEPCSDDVANTYISNENASYWIYPQLIDQNIQVWVYSGDVDADVPITGTLQWLQMIKEELQLPTEQKWRRWWIAGNNNQEAQVGGMYWKLDGITFVSVRGAGHMVPQDKPASAAILLENFLQNKPMPQR